MKIAIPVDEKDIKSLWLGIDVRIQNLNY